MAYCITLNKVVIKVVYDRSHEQYLATGKPINESGGPCRNFRHKNGRPE
jgi:hypothetical protein